MTELTPIPPFDSFQTIKAEDFRSKLPFSSFVVNVDLQLTSQRQKVYECITSYPDYNCSIFLLNDAVLAYKNISFNALKFDMYSKYTLTLFHV